MSDHPKGAIKTSFDYPPIPVRNCDWSAVRDDYEPPDPIGRGATEAEAIADLLEQEEDAAEYLDPDRLREDRDERRRLDREP